MSSTQHKFWLSTTTFDIVRRAISKLEATDVDERELKEFLFQVENAIGDVLYEISPDHPKRKVILDHLVDTQRFLCRHNLTLASQACTRAVQEFDNLIMEGTPMFSPADLAAKLNTPNEMEKLIALAKHVSFDTETPNEMEKLVSHGEVVVNPQKFMRKTFFVDAIRVTAENFEAVASWCGAEIITDDGATHLKLDVIRPLNKRQTRAYAGDWILTSHSGYKIYNANAFSRCFVPAPNEGWAVSPEDMVE